LRYRLLLGYLAHYLQAGTSDRTFLEAHILKEMKRLTQVADKLVRMPRGKSKQAAAGPPFQLPYTLNLPVREQDRWRQHLYVHGLADNLIDRMTPDEDQPNKDFLNQLKLSEQERTTMTQNANQPSPGGTGGGGTPPGGGGPA